MFVAAIPLLAVFNVRVLVGTVTEALKVALIATYLLPFLVAPLTVIVAVPFLIALTVPLPFAFLVAIASFSLLEAQFKAFSIFLTSLPSLSVPSATTLYVLDVSTGTATVAPLIV